MSGQMIDIPGVAQLSRDSFTTWRQSWSAVVLDSRLRMGMRLSDRHLTLITLTLTLLSLSPITLNSTWVYRHTAVWIRHGTGSLGHRVNWSFGSSFTFGSRGQRVIILTRCETRFFPVFEKMPKMQNIYLKYWNDKSHCQVSVVGLKSMDESARLGSNLSLASRTL